MWAGRSSATKRDYVAFMPKPDAATAVCDLAVTFEHYNERHPHSALKYHSPRVSPRGKPHRSILKMSAAAKGCTICQVLRPLARLHKHGPQGLVSRRRAKPSNNRLDAGAAKRALTIIYERYRAARVLGDVRRSASRRGSYF